MRAAPLARSILIAGLVGLAGACSASPAREPAAGAWRAWLTGPGGELPFELELAPDPDGWSAVIVNGIERIDVPRVELTDGTLTLGFDHYGSAITANVSDGGRRLDGEWSRTSLGGNSTRMTFRATAGEAPRFPGDPPKGAASISGRWRVRFESDELDAVGIFEQAADGSVTGTFLTATGDYRFLAGRMESNDLSLSCFDGAHAFLFRAELQADGTLAGGFWSRDSWHENWTAKLDSQAEIDDPYAQTRIVDGIDVAALRYPDLDGDLRSLDAPELMGEAQLLVVFGSWCPNCNDCTDDLVRLDRRYRSRGLSIVGLAFEMTGSPDLDRAQVRRYVSHHGIEYPVLLAGTADKQQASEAFPLVDRIRAFPTLIFRDRRGEVRAVYSGYSGPATGEAYERQLEGFEQILEELLPITDEA